MFNGFRAGLFLAVSGLAGLGHGAPAAAQSLANPGIISSDNGLVQKVHGRHCDYSFGPKKGRAAYMHRHQYKCHFDARFRKPGTYRGYGDPDQFRSNPSEPRATVTKRCWLNDWGGMTCDRL